jgi:predicted nucleic acid-binding protein
LSSSASKRIYLDVCTLCRPFDDQKYLRIRLETEALNLILSKIQSGQYKMMVSKVHYQEISDISDQKERIELEAVLNGSGQIIKANNRLARERAEELIGMGFGIADAAHLAFAEQSGANFISCDDRLIKKCQRHDIKVWAGTPTVFCDKEGLK